MKKAAKEKIEKKISGCNCRDSHLLLLFLADVSLTVIIKKDSTSNFVAFVLLYAMLFWNTKRKKIPLELGVGSWVGSVESENNLRISKMEN